MTVGVEVRVDVAVGVDVGSGGDVGLRVGVAVGVLVGISVGEGVGVGLLVGVGVLVGGDSVTSGVRVITPKSGVGVAGMLSGPRARKNNVITISPAPKTASATVSVIRIGGRPERERFKAVCREYQ